MTNEERAFFESCDSYKNYSSIDEYIEDIRHWLTLSSWHYSEQRAQELIEANKAYIEKAYASREPASDAGAEVGFCCG